MWLMQETILKPNVIFFLKYRNKKNKELLQKYVHSVSLADVLILHERARVHSHVRYFV